MSDNEKNDKKEEQPGLTNNGREEDQVLNELEIRKENSSEELALSRNIENEDEDQSLPKEEQLSKKNNEQNQILEIKNNPTQMSQEDQNKILNKTLSEQNESNENILNEPSQQEQIKNKDENENENASQDIILTLENPETKELETIQNKILSNDNPFNGNISEDNQNNNFENLQNKDHNSELYKKEQIQQHGNNMSQETMDVKINIVTNQDNIQQSISPFMNNNQDNNNVIKIQNIRN